MKRIALNVWFSLPRLGNQVFSDLMRSRVQYDKRMGFKITASSNLSRALQVLSEALGESVSVANSCFVCERPLDNERNSATVCSDCTSSDDAYALYTMKFVQKMEA